MFEVIRRLARNVPRCFVARLAAGPEGEVGIAFDEDFGSGPIVLVVVGGDGGAALLTGDDNGVLFDLNFHSVGGRQG